MQETILYKQDTMDRIILIERIIEKKMTLTEGYVDLGVSYRQACRLMRRYKEEGRRGIIPRYSKVSNRKILDETKENILRIIEEKYVDFGPTLISEKLKEVEGIEVSKETIRKWIIDKGFWKSKKRKRARIHQSRERRSRFGELVQIDGSPHDWFEGRGRRCCLILMVDDATSKIVSGRFEGSETTFGYMKAVRSHIKKYGRPIAYYSDKHSIFRQSREQTKDGIIEDTQFHRALKDLGIGLICANSPQAKGRVERANGVLQDRLVKELRLNNISDIDAANKFLEEYYIPKYNAKFGCEASCKEDGHRELVHKDCELDLILSKQDKRKIDKNLEFSLEGKRYQILNAGKGHRMRQGHVNIYNKPDGTVAIMYEGKKLDYREVYRNSGPIIADSKEIAEVLDNLLDTSYPQNSHHINTPQKASIIEAHFEAMI